MGYFGLENALNSTRRTVGDDGVLSASDDVTVTVTNADLTTTRSMYGGGVTRVRVYNDSTSTVISNTVHFGLAGILGSTGRTVGNDGTDSGIIRYTPYGTVRTGDVADLAVDQTFTGQTNDPGTGLIDYNARQYDPVLAKFIQPDTIVPDIANPQDLNRYMYVGGNPVNMTDPSGNRPVLTPKSSVTERTNVSRILLVNGDLEGAWGLCRSGRGCKDEYFDTIMHANIIANGANFDDGKHNDGKIDGDIRRGDFKAIRDNRHGTASEFDQWTAARVLYKGQYDGYGNNNSFFEAVTNFVSDYWTQIAAGLVCVSQPQFCPLAQAAAFSYRAAKSSGLNPLNWSAETWGDLAVTAVATIGFGVSGLVSTAAGGASLAAYATDTAINLAFVLVLAVCYAQNKGPNAVCAE